MQRGNYPARPLGEGQDVIMLKKKKEEEERKKKQASKQERNPGSRPQDSTAHRETPRGLGVDGFNSKASC